MSNLFTNNPLILDTVWTAGTIPAALANMLVEAKRIEWFNPTSTSHQCQIQDINGNNLINAQCEVANQSQVLWQDSQHPLKLKMGQWVLATLGSGQVLIYK